MQDIYLVYAREDESIARALHALLSQQWTVWWDENIVGDVSQVIESEIPQSGCVLPIISAVSRQKSTVVDEMRLARSHNIPMIPVLIDGSNLPYPFGTLSAVEIKGWNGKSDHLGLRKLRSKLSRVVSPREIPKRPAAIANGLLELPTPFLSVSSYNTQLDLDTAVSMLRMFKVPAILVSAYDLIDKREPKKLIRELKRYKKEGGFVLIDSGNYEKARLEDNSWKISDYKKALSRIPHDWVFCYDNMDPSKGKNKSIREIIESVNRDQAFTASHVLPVVHAPKLKKGGYKLDDIPEIIRSVSEKLGPPMIAIPERELGAGLISRAKMIKKIREELNKLPYYQPLHILGTGNPWAIAVFAAAGADTFDGLEWCRYVIDKEKEVINHFHLMDLYETFDDSKVGYTGQVVLNNIEYFSDFRKVMSEYYALNDVKSHVQGVLNNKKAFSLLNAQFPDLFK